MYCFSFFYWSLNHTKLNFTANANQATNIKHDRTKWLKEKNKEHALIQHTLFFHVFFCLFVPASPRMSLRKLDKTMYPQYNHKQPMLQCQALFSTYTSRWNVTSLYKEHFNSVFPPLHFGIGFLLSKCKIHRTIKIYKEFSKWLFFNLLNSCFF